MAHQWSYLSKIIVPQKFFYDQVIVEVLFGVDGYFVFEKILDMLRYDSNTFENKTALRKK